MNKELTLKFIGTLAMAISLAFSACGDKGAGSADNAAAAPSARQGFSPMVLKGTALALGANLEKEQAYKIVNAYTDRFFAMMKMDADEVNEAKKAIAEFKKDPFKDVDKDAQDFLQRSGLGDAEYKWGVVSLEGTVDAADGEPECDGLAVAIAVNADVEKLVSAFRAMAKEKGDDSISFEEVSIEGEKAWHIVPKSECVQKSMQKSKADPFFVSLDGKLVLIAMSRSMIERQIRLFRRGEGKGDALNGFSAAKGELAHISLPNIGEILSKNVPQDGLKVVSEVLPNGEEVVKGLKTLALDIKVSPDGTTKQSISLEAASENDADMLRTLAKTGLIIATAQAVKDESTPKAAVDLIKSIKIEGSDGKIVVKETDLIYGFGCAFFRSIAGLMVK